MSTPAEQSSWVTDIADFLRTQNIVGQEVYAYEMSEDIKRGIMVIPPLEGIPYDIEIRGRFKGTFQCLVRTPDLGEAHGLGAQVMNAMTMKDTDLGLTRIVQIYPMVLPLVYPISEAGVYEASVNLNITFIDTRLTV